MPGGINLNRILAWFKIHSSALKGMAAAVVILSALILLIPHITKTMRPDILVRINVNKDTLPNDLSEWLQDLSRFIEWNRYSLKEMNESNPKLYAIFENSVFKKYNVYNRKFDKLQIEFTNQTNNAISGIRLKFEIIYSFWGAKVTGTFLRANDIQVFEAEILKGFNNSSIILPELPTLPPSSMLQIEIYGNIGPIKPIMTAIDHSFSIIEMTEVQKGFLIELYKNPYVAILLIIAGILILLLILIPVSTNIINNKINNKIKNIFYNTACKEAIKGNSDDAMVLLNQAVRAGYSDRDHALNDNDLECLREREDFKELFALKISESNISTD